MERNFIELSSQGSVNGGFDDSGSGRSSGVLRPFSKEIKSDIWESGDIQNFGGPMMKSQYLGGTTEQWISCAPAQLTIFYGGTVNVFNDVTPEKVQAIILLAGTVTTHDVADQARVSQNISPYSGVPTPIEQSNNGVKVSMTIGMTTNLVNNVDVPRRISSIGAMMSSAIPQARRASLARFLEKRKERAMKASPSGESNNKEDDCDCSSGESIGFAFSATSIS